MMKKGFTIIETLVAITILMIAISGPLTVSFRGLNAAINARDQMVANFLAQEGIEYFRWVKDTNIKQADQSIFWLQGLQNCSPSETEPTQGCGFDVWEGINTYDLCKSTYNTPCKLYYDDVNKQYKSSATNNRETPFYRKVYITDWGGNGVSTPHYATLVSEVWWDTGSMTDNRIVLETKIFDVQK